MTSVGDVVTPHTDKPAPRKLRRHRRRRERIAQQRRGSSYRDFVLRRLAKLPVMLFVISVLVFAMTRMGGSPAGIYLRHDMTPEEVNAVYEKYHLNDNVFEQYWAWLKGILVGDLGWSGVASEPVASALVNKLAVTLELGFFASVVMIVAGIALGTIGGARQNRLGDHVTRVVSIIGSSLPMFWFALLALYLFYLVLGIAPMGRADRAIYAAIEHPTGMYTIDAVLAGSRIAFVDAISHLWLPVLVLGYCGTAEIARIMRSSLVDEMGKEYVDTARAKGLPEKLVVRRHARRNALIPTLTMIGLSMGSLIGGTVVVELIFQFPGMGRWITDAVLRGDRATIMAFVLVMGAAYLLVNLVVDLLYAHVDRRIELGA